MAFMFPWSNFHELNLDWILSVVKEAKEIFVNGEGDIQHAVETADQALETAEQAAAGVIADGAVTIEKVNDTVFNLLAYIVSGSVNPVSIPAGSLVILRKSTVAGANDGIYVAAADIPANSVVTAADLTQPQPLPDAGGMNYILSFLGGEIDDTVTSINAIERGLVIVVDGNNATSSVPVGELAYLKNNANGLQEGLYANISSAPYPTTGGTADNSVFSAVPNVLNGIKEDLTAVETIVGDGVLTDFTATDLTGAVHELKGDVTDIAGDITELSGDIADVESTITSGTNVTFTPNSAIASNFSFTDATIKKFGAIYTLAMKFFTAQAVTAGEYNFGVVNPPPTKNITGALIRSENSSVAGGFNLSTNGTLYVNLSENIPYDRTFFINGSGI